METTTYNKKEKVFNNKDDKSWMIGFLKKRGYVFGTVKLKDKTANLIPNKETFDELLKGGINK